MLKRIIISLLICLTLVQSVGADDFSPTVEFSYNDVAVVGSIITIDIKIYNAYIENSIIEVDTENSPGWGETERSYFDFISTRKEIELLTEDQTLDVQFEIKVVELAPEKTFTIPIVFYGKAGECAEGCVPFRKTYAVELTTLNPVSASQLEEVADNEFEKENYSLAKMYYENAKTLYEKLNDTEKVKEVEDKISKCNTGSEAIQLFETGKTKCQLGNKSGAVQDFYTAISKFEEIENATKIEEIEQWISSCQEEAPPAGQDNGPPYLLYLAGGIILCAIVIGALVAKKK
ncbi:MAG: hypothetical protein ACXQTP_05965 [Candidatus Methanofastidiosia archaeon]